MFRVSLREARQVSCTYQEKVLPCISPSVLPALRLADSGAPSRETKLWLLTRLMPKRAVRIKVGVKVWVSLATMFVRRERVCVVRLGRPAPTDGLRASE